MSTRRSTPAWLVVTMFAAVTVLVVLSAVTGQWWITVLGVLALGAATVPFSRH
jgi:hypothetical protein